MNGIIYYTKIRDEYNSKNMEHMIGEKLLEIGLEREFGRKLAFDGVYGAVPAGAGPIGFGGAFLLGGDECLCGLVGGVLRGGI